MKKYFTHILTTTRTLLDGLRVTAPHLRKGHAARTPMGVAEDNYFAQANLAVTVQYPAEQIPVPDHGRYRLDMEADDCIVCDKCARICPVDCIAIEGIKAAEEIGTTSDGTKKRLHLPVFDIDMAKCCFCGLCTTVCPTECLTMTKVYDFSEYDRSLFNYQYAQMTPEEADLKRAEAAAATAAKAQAKAAESAVQATDLPSTDAPASDAPKPAGPRKIIIKKKEG